MTTELKVKTADAIDVKGADTVDELMANAKAAAKADKAMKRRRNLLLAGVAFAGACAALAGGTWWVMVGQHYVSTDNAYVGADTAQINSQISGQIAEVRVSDTQVVHRGDIIAVIDPADARLALARAQADYVRTLSHARQYSAQEGNAAAQVGARQADVARASADYSRRAALVASGAVSQEEVTSTLAALNSARANLAAAQQSVASQRAVTSSAGPEAAAARAAVEQARLSVTRTVIRAPIDGVVVQRSAQVGQRIDPGQPLMRITPLSQAYVDANFKEDQLGRVRIGQPVTLHADLYGEHVTYHGRVAGIGGGTGSAFAVIPSQNATGNWIKVVQRVPVRIALTPAELARHPLRVGLSMQATIDIRDRH